jgi:hypothetical protein
MQGKKERQRKQREKIRHAAIKNAWAHGPYTGTIPTRTDQQIKAYEDGAQVWSAKGNTLVETMQGVRILICKSDNPLVQQARELLLNAIKDFDQ